LTPFLAKFHKAGKRGFYKGEMKMQKEDLKGAYVGRRGFLKAMTMAGM